MAGPPHVPLASPYRDSGSSVRMSQNAGPSVPSSLTPIRCTTAGMLIVSLEPLARRLEAWLALPSPSRWLAHTIRLGYTIQFASPYFIVPWGNDFIVPSLGVAVSRKSIAHIRGPHPELQKLWAALCLLRRSAEREGCLQAEVGPLDSGCHRLGVPIPRRAVPHGGEGSLHTECCLLLCVGARRLSGRHL